MSIDVNECLNECLNYCQLLNFSNILRMWTWCPEAPRSLVMFLWPGCSHAPVRSKILNHCVHLNLLCHARPCSKAYETCECWTSSVFFSFFFLNDIFLSYSSHFMWPFPDAPRSMWLAVTLGNPTRGCCNKHELLRKFEKIWETDGCPDWNRQQESKRRIKKNSAYAKIMIISDHLRSYHDHISAKMCQNLSHRRHLVVVWRISPISPLGGLLLVLICFDDGRVDLDGAPNPLKAAIRRAWGANQPIIPPISANFVNSTLLNSESVEKTYVKQL
jgi:hypothetical protein